MSTGDRMVKLRWLRDTYVAAIESGLEPRDLAAVGSRLEKVLAEIDALSDPEEHDAVDELKGRRAARLAGAETAGS